MAIAFINGTGDSYAQNSPFSYHNHATNRDGQPAGT